MRQLSWGRFCHSELTGGLLRKLDYRGYRLTEFRVPPRTQQDAVADVRWQLGRIKAGIETVVGTASSQDEAQRRVDENLQGDARAL